MLFVEYLSLEDKKMQKQKVETKHEKLSKCSTVCFKPSTFFYPLKKFPFIIIRISGLLSLSLISACT